VTGPAGQWVSRDIRGRIGGDRELLEVAAWVEGVLPGIGEPGVKS
jgi:hypothetical protein